MEDNFYVGVVHHSRRMLKPEYKEKLVLYSNDSVNYLDLIGNNYYTTDTSNRDYVVRETLITTDVSLYREDYLYLLSRYKDKGATKKRKKLIKNLYKN